MKKPKQINSTTQSLIIALACFGLGPNGFAISPPPDGGYPGGNTAEGQNALLSVTSGGYNTAVGFFSLRGNTTNSFNTAIGAGALLANSGDENTATGVGALFSNGTGNNNNAIGAFALFSNHSGSFNNAFGGAALFNNTTGGQNEAFGDTALWSNQTGTSNTAIGDSAGFSISGNNNVCIGAEVYGVAGENATIRIADNLSTAAGASACYIGGIAGQTVDPMGSGAVYIDNNSKLGVIQSSRRFKRDIKPIENASEAIFKFEPVTFHYKSDAKNTDCYGLIAEDVANVRPELVARDTEGKPYSVRYDQVNAMLLNEFLKEHKKVQAQESKIETQDAAINELKSAVAEQHRQIEALTAGLQKQSAEFATIKATPQVVTNR